MEVREYIAEDYETIKHWWVDAWQNGLTVPKEALPERGFIVEDVCVIFVYATEAVFNCIGYPCINPKRWLDGIGMFPALVRKAKELGTCVAYPENKFLKTVYENEGFTMINEYNKEMSYINQAVI